MIKLLLRYCLVLSFLASSSISMATPADWFNLMMKGEDQQAAKALATFIEKLPKNSDPSYLAMLQQTVESLRAGCASCVEDAKIVLFRHFDSASDPFWKTKNKAVFFSRAMKDKKGKPNSDGIAKWRSMPFWTLEDNHSKSGGRHRGIKLSSPLISTTFDPRVAEGEYQVIMKVCPNRLILNSGKFQGEWEFLIPFFVHPEEILAVVKTHNLGRGKIPDGDFDVIYNGLSKTHSDDETKKLLKKYAKSNERFVESGRNSRTSPYGFMSQLLEKKWKILAKTTVNSCSRFFKSQ
ncbi:MAG: hypothetical protein AABY64_14420 [Bdellovibrionota bacterium]